jgi:D-glycero-D-manno-heptose 1,7-bisphosphate phosphatase
MCKQFADVGAPISRVYYSPYHPTAGIGRYLKDDFSRKPNPGMIVQAKNDYLIDLGSSVLIGDKGSDILAGSAAGVGTNLLFSNQKLPELKGINYTRIVKLQDAMPFLKLKKHPRGIR